MFASSLITKISSFLACLILIRVLSPDEFGVLLYVLSVVCGPSTAPEGDGWSGNYFYNYALDGSGGREFLLYDADTEFPSFTRNSMMADKNNIIRVLGYDGDQGAQLVLTTGTI